MRQPYEIENLANMFVNYAKNDPTGQQAVAMLTGEEITDAIKIVAIATAKLAYSDANRPTYWNTMP